MTAIGETVYINGGSYGRIDVRTGTVEKISPTGVIRVRTAQGYAYSFQPDGRERGGDKYYPRRLIDKVQYDKLAGQAAAKLRADQAARALADASRIRMHVDNKGEILRAIDKTRAMVERL